MKALIIIALVLLGLILVIAALMLVPVRVFLEYSDEGFFFDIKVLGISLGGKGKDKEEDEKKAEDEGKKSESFGGVKAYIKKHGIAETVALIAELVSDILKCASGVLERCVLERLCLRIVCVGSDAAAAAMEYGTVCATVYPIIGYLHTVADIREKGESVEIRCDYDKSEHELFADLVVRLRVFYLCVAVIRLIKQNVIGKAVKLFAKGE